MNTRRDGLYLLLIGIAVFVLVSLAMEFRLAEPSIDFKAVYSSSQCVIQHCDPYQLSGLAVYPPTTYIVAAPFGILPWGLAQALWAIVTCAALILAALLMWDCGAQYAPRLSGGQLGLLLASSAIFVGNSNPAGIAIGLCAIAVWCFMSERFTWAGILCFAISLAIKPHDTGLVWLGFLLVRGTHRKRALQTFAVTAVLVLAAMLWISQTAPHWLDELRSNIAAMNVHGANNDPGPDGITAKGKTLYTMLGLSVIVSVFKDNPNFYNSISYLLCGTLLLIWIATTLRSRQSAALTWLALAAVAPLSLLVAYHRAYDAKLLLVTVPACAMLWAKGGPTAWFALLLNTAGILITGEIPLALFLRITQGLHPNIEEFSGKLLTVLLLRPAPLLLLTMSIFYLSIFVRRARHSSEHRPV